MTVRAPVSVAEGGKVLVGDELVATLEPAVVDSPSATPIVLPALPWEASQTP